MRKQLGMGVFFAALVLGCAGKTHLAHAGGGPTYAEPGYEQSGNANSPTSSGSTTSPSATAANPNGRLGYPSTTVVPGNVPYGVVASVQTSGLFKLADSPTVYVDIGGTIHPFTSQAAFLAWGFTFNNVQTLLPTQFSTYTVGSALGIPDGSLVTAAGSATYIVFGGLKNPATPPSLISHLGLSLANTVTISVSDLSSIPDGPLVQ